MDGTRTSGGLRRGVLRISGSVALVAGAVQVATGLRGVRGATDVSNAEVDSELRFYASWYVVAGLLMRRAATDAALDRALRPSIEAGWLLGAVGRMASTHAAGRPQRMFLVLAAAEALLAGVLALVPPDAE